MNLLTTLEAAARLNLSQRAVNDLINNGHLPAQRFGKAWVIRESDLSKAKDRPKPGKPGKQKTKVV